MLLVDRNDLATRGNKHNSSKANHKAKLRRRRPKPHLPPQRRPLHLHRLPQWVQQPRSHNPLPLSYSSKAKPRCRKPHLLSHLPRLPHIFCVLCIY
ncbi:hypothetical protein K503DRAFT_870488 [Rhizopogon vinicolor AM-OR11-026]|uniref:Uncharacterized protein n=1 Tax=Rhizopogon vinicolor AM-OR11-026 TaxID=1314800 RepID=A0A1B7MGS3_9AGAM|nr:hypothetical protein K503DRAFT_870488 [Rhizopogon vinicolor AM-OR11-026]